MVAPVPAHISKLPRRKFSCPSRRSIPNSRPVNRLQPLGTFSVAPVLCFQQLAASFPKILRWGVPRFPFQLRNTHYPLSTFVNSFVSYHMHVSQAFSCNYALFCATARRYLPYFQEPAHSFDRHRGWGGIGWYISQGLRRNSVEANGLRRLRPKSASRMAQCAALAVEEAPAGDRVKRGGACLRPRWTLCAHRCRCFLSPATHTEPPAGVLAGLQVAAMPTRNSRGFSAPTHERRPQRLKPC